MKALESMDQHWSIGIIKHILTDLDYAVRPEPNQVSVKRRMVQVAQRHTVGHGRFAEWISVRHDVRGFEKFLALETADGAVVLIGPNNPFTESRLVQPLSKQAGYIPPTNRRLFF
ncbi:MAG: hypothetical protein NUW22_06700, partial [Acidobacteria bacterium]|nr:hypothetical protein [Acidobacteriota bacterium]